MQVYAFLPPFSLFAGVPLGVRVVFAFELYQHAAVIGAEVNLIVKFFVAAILDPAGKAVITLQRIPVNLAFNMVEVDKPGIFPVLRVAVPIAVLIGAVVVLFKCAVAVIIFPVG